MKISLKLKLTALISLLVLVVMIAVSALYLMLFVRHTLLDVEDIGGSISQETYTLARQAMRDTKIPPYINSSDFAEVRAFIHVRLGQDQSLLSLMQAVVAYYPSIDYVALTGPNRLVLAYNDPALIGHLLPYASPLLLHAGLIRELKMIYGPPQDYEVVFPLQMENQPFGDIRVGVSTALLASEVTPQIKGALELAALVIVFATLTAGLLSFRALRPLAVISQSLDRIARGEFTEPVQIERADEWGILSSKLNLLGEQMRGDKAAYLALKENTDQMIANLADGLMLFDDQDRLILATPSVWRFLQRPADGMISQTAAQAFDRDDPLDKLLREIFRDRLALRARQVDIPENKQTPRVALTSHLVFEKGRLRATLVMLRDAGNRAQLEDQIGATTKLAALGRLTSGVAHEVKNPLNAMIIQVEILKAKLQRQGDGDGVKPQLDVLSEEIRRLDRVVKTFLDFTRPLEICPSETSVPDLVKEVFTLAEPHAKRCNVQLVMEPNGGVPPVKLDRDLMKQALLNLVLNGCQAMPKGGELRVRPKAGPKAIDLEITDQGVGIPEEARSRIFSLYYTTKPNGTGVGLAMAFRIVQLHNGSIDFTSEINQGTTFRVSLPL
jgi:signal transduction histidine kinase/HAMP domain-containing protein